MAWCLVKHRDNFTFTLPYLTLTDCTMGKTARKKRQRRRNWRDVDEEGTR
jgi:hypothetical protein